MTASCYGALETVGVIIIIQAVTDKFYSCNRKFIINNELCCYCFMRPCCTSPDSLTTL